MRINDIDYFHSGEVQCIAYDSSGNKTLENSSYSYLAVVPAIVPDEFITLKDFEDNDDTIASTIGESSAGYIIRGPADCTALIGGCVTLTAHYDDGHANDCRGFGTKARWLKAVSFGASICVYIRLSLYIGYFRRAV